MSTQEPVKELYVVVPHPKKKGDYKGRLVRTKIAMKNGWGEIPPGTIATITSQSPKGSSIEAVACDCCGMKAIMSRIGAEYIEFIEPIKV